MFILAEAARKDYISESASEFYEAGIIANMNYLGVSETNEYLGQT